MIDIQNSRQLKIKRANTDWWINEKSIVGANGMTYIAYVTDMGEIHIKELDAKCSKSPSRDVCICRFNNNYADEHNAPSICITESGKIIVAYTGHAAVPVLRYKVTKNPYDIHSFGEEKALLYDGTVTYAQLFENTIKKELWLFTRISSVTWGFRYSTDEGETWSEPHTFLKSKDGGLFYLDVRKQNIPTPDGGGEQWFFALYGHPKISADHTIRSGIFTSDGQLTNPDGSKLDVSLYDMESTISLPELSVVYSAPAGETVRLLSVAPTLPLRVGFAPFVLGDAASATYFSATFTNGSWVASEPIAKAGEFLAPIQTDGSQTYISGMSYYYGVGEAGYHPADGGDIDTNRIYLARKDNSSWLLESYVSKNAGLKYELEQVIRKIPESENKKIWRPTVPIYAQDNLPVYWHEGSYSAHTGGWHCDVVMYVEYDD